MKKIKATFITLFDVHDINSWSGIPYHVYNSLRCNGFDVEFYGALPGPFSCFSGRVASHIINLKQKLYKKLFSVHHLYEYDPLILKLAWEEAEKQAKMGSPDLIISCDAQSTAELRTKVPIAIWHDATFSGLLNFYPFFSNLSNESIRHGNQIHQKILNNCAAIAYSSDWAANLAKNDYRVNNKLIRVIPFGASLNSNYSEEDMLRMIDARSLDNCKLILIGRSWIRKGCDFAIEVTQKMNELGVPTTLTIIGTEAPDQRVLPSFVKMEGLLSKSKPAELNKIEQNLRESHFMVMPTIAEAFGVVFCEAAAYAVPSLAPHIGGIPTIIKDGLSGMTFPISASPLDYAKYLLSVFNSKKTYRSMAMESWYTYRNTLNWDAGAVKFRQMCEEIL